MVVPSGPFKRIMYGSFFSYIYNIIYNSKILIIAKIAIRIINHNDCTNGNNNKNKKNNSNNSNDNNSNNNINQNSNYIYYFA